MTEVEAVANKLGHRAADFDRSAHRGRGKSRRAQDVDAAGSGSRPADGTGSRWWARSWNWANGWASPCRTRARYMPARSCLERLCCGGEAQNSESLGSIERGGGRDDHDREPAICLDPVRQADDRRQRGWKLSEVQWAFTLFIVLGTWVMPSAGWLIDRMGPRLFMTLAGVLCGVGWAGMGSATSLTSSMCSTPSPASAPRSVTAARFRWPSKWFPDKRGLASGIAVAGYGAGATMFNPIFAYMIHAVRLPGHVPLHRASPAASSWLRRRSSCKIRPRVETPRCPCRRSRPRVRRHNEEFNSVEMLTTPQFYVLYVAMLMIGIGGLMTTAQSAAHGAKAWGSAQRRLPSLSR